MSLTPRQIEVADLLCEGKLHKEIADILQIKRGTTEHHVQDAHARTNTRNVAELFWWMLRNKAGKTYEKAKALI